MGNQDIIDNMLSDMRSHVSSLQSKLSVADAAVSKSQTVNDKIVIMKEYQDKVSTMNSCWRSKNRKGLVANLQHENRQMLALEEENRRLRFALKEMEEGLQLIMADYRRVISGFSRFDVLLNFARKQFNNNPGGCIEHEKFMKLAAIVDECMSVAENRMIEQEEIIAELRTENETLRELAYFRPKLHSTAKTHATPDGENVEAPVENNGGPTDKSTPTKSPASRKTPGRNSQIPSNGEEDLDLLTVSPEDENKGKSNGRKGSSETSAGSGQYSWPFHVDREMFKSKYSDIMNLGMGEDNNAKLGRKAQLPRENPGCRSVFSPKSSVASGSSFTGVNLASSMTTNSTPLNSGSKMVDAPVENTDWTTVQPEEGASDQSSPIVKGEKKSLNSAQPQGHAEFASCESSKTSPAAASHSTMTPASTSLV